MYATLGTAIGIWLSTKWIQRLHIKATRFVAILLVLAMGYEAMWHLVPNPPERCRSLLVIGDSVTAGLGDSPDEVTWPNRLASKHQIQIDDISHVGETAGSALKRVKPHESAADTILVEIGGNDVLGNTSATKFAMQLEELISHLRARNSETSIIMFELPLPPLAHGYGMAQRTIAARYNVRLVPKRVFLSILADDDSTLDSIHLSQDGHDRMANVVASFLGLNR